MVELIKDSVDTVKGLIKQVFGAPKKVGLVLGGGGARGIAHVGVIKVLVENKIPIHLIAGSSSGALFGALFAGGMNPYDMARAAKATDWGKLVRLRFSLAEPVSAAGIEKLVIDNIGNKNIEDLRVPLSIVATDLNLGERVVISRGNAAKAVHASSSIPGIFSPVRFQGRLLADGLIVDNLPVQVARGMGADFIIAVDVVPAVELTKWDPTVASVIERAMDISCRSAAVHAKELADVVIEPVRKNISATSLDHADELIKMGEEAALKALPSIKDKLRLS